MIKFGGVWMWFPPDIVATVDATRDALVTVREHTGLTRTALSKATSQVRLAARNQHVTVVPVTRPTGVSREGKPTYSTDPGYPPDFLTAIEFHRETS
jgi:hypothetical protein